ncbi:Acot8 [Symbiodinium natans]|uniref:Acot8 protein n=1 Tax=Symbiodinium natans TaxID=878477 RepID=A0A812SB99_9DINO|nr:Acot8 [Symbiodinium natans]
MPSIVESRRIYSEIRKKRLQLDEAYELGRDAAPVPDPINLSSLRCIARLVLEATKETKQVKHFLQVMGVDVESAHDDHIVEICSPRNAVYAIRVREALLRLAELRRVLQDRIRQRGVDPKEDKKRKALLNELKNLRKALSTTHLSRQMHDVEECLGNLKTLLETFEFSDEVQQYTQKAAGAIAALQNIHISRPILKAMAKTYARNQMAGSQADPKAAHSRPWKSTVWKTGRGKQEQQPHKSARDARESQAELTSKAAPADDGELQFHMPETDLVASEVDDIIGSLENEVTEGTQDAKPSREASKRRRRSSTKKEHAKEKATDGTGKPQPKPSTKEDQGDKNAGKNQPQPASARQRSSKVPRERSERTSLPAALPSRSTSSRKYSGAQDRRARSGSAGRTRRRSVPVAENAIDATLTADQREPSANCSSPPVEEPPQGREATPTQSKAEMAETGGKEVVSTSPDEDIIPALGAAASATAQQAEPHIGSRHFVTPSEAASAEADASGRQSASRPSTSVWSPTEVGTPAIEAEAPMQSPITEDGRRKRQKRISSVALANGKEIEPLSSRSSGWLSERAEESPSLICRNATDAANTERNQQEKVVAKRPSTQPGQPTARARWAPLTRLSAAKQNAEAQGLVVNAGGSSSRWPSLRAALMVKQQLRQVPSTAPARVVPMEQQTTAKKEKNDALNQQELTKGPLNQIKFRLPAGWSRRPVPRAPARFVWRLDSGTHDDSFVGDWTALPSPGQGMPKLAGKDEEDAGGSSDSGEDALTVVDVVRSLCKQDEEEWSEEELTLRELFTMTPTIEQEEVHVNEGGKSDPTSAWDAFAQEQSTISYLSRSADSESESEDEEEFLRQLLQSSRFCCWLHPLCRGHCDIPRVSTAGLPQIWSATSSSPRDLHRHQGQVSIESVLTYRFHRGFRNQLVPGELEDQYREEMCKDPQIPCFCRRCVWHNNPVLKLA